MRCNLIIQARTAVIQGALRENIWVEVEENVIVSIHEGNSVHVDRHVEGVLIPGFIDIHCHGGGGNYFSATSDEEIRNVINTHRVHGTTTIFASLVTEPLDELKNQIGRLVPFAQRGDIAGIHLEGPYLAHSRCGAHDPTLLRTPRLSEFEELVSAGQGFIKMVTIAPELEGAIGAIEYLVANKIIAAIGHSAADYDLALRGVEAGATVITHFPNAVSKLDDSGHTLAQLAMSDSRLTLELILDGNHVKNEEVSRIYNQASARIALITDAMAAAGSSDGHYLVGALPVTVEDSVARLDSNGALAGSTLTMDSAFFNMMTDHGYSLPEAVAASSTIAARTAGLHDRGELSVGKRADLLEVNLADRLVSIIE